MKTITGMPKKAKSALAAVVATRARWQTVNAIDAETKAEILHENIFYEEETERRITNTNADFLMSETDFAQYCDLVYTRNLAKGLDSGGEGMTFWPIQKAALDAEDKYIDIMIGEIPGGTPEIARRIKLSPMRRKEFFAIIGL